MGGAHRLAEQIDLLRTEEDHVNVGHTGPVGFAAPPRCGAPRLFNGRLDLDWRRHDAPIGVAHDDARDRNLQLDERRLPDRDADGRSHVDPVAGHGLAGPLLRNGRRLWGCRFPVRGRRADSAEHKGRCQRCRKNRAPRSRFHKRISHSLSLALCYVACRLISLDREFVRSVLRSTGSSW